MGFLKPADDESAPIYEEDRTDIQPLSQTSFVYDAHPGQVGRQQGVTGHGIVSNGETWPGIKSRLDPGGGPAPRAPAGGRGQGSATLPYGATPGAAPAPPIPAPPAPPATPAPPAPHQALADAAAFITSIRWSWTSDAENDDHNNAHWLDLVVRVLLIGKLFFL